MLPIARSSRMGYHICFGQMGALRMRRHPMLFELLPHLAENLSWEDKRKRSCPPNPKTERLYPELEDLEPATQRLYTLRSAWSQQIHQSELPVIEIN